MSDGSAIGSQTADRCLKVLRLIGLRNSMRFSDIVHETGLSPAIVRRLLVSLLNAGMIRQESSGKRYMLGPEVFALAERRIRPDVLQDLAYDSVKRLAQLSGDTAFLSLRRGYSTICVTRIEGDHPIRTHVLQEGDQHPLGLGAAAIAILGALDSDDVAEILGLNKDRIQSYREPLDFDRLHSLIDAARQTRIAVNPGLVFSGSWAIAAAIRDETGAPVAALTIAAVETRMAPQRQVELAIPLLDEVARVEARLSAAARDTFPTRPTEDTA